MRPPVLASILRRSGRRLPAGIRQRVGRVLARGAGEVRSLAAKGTSEPRLSVIVPVYNVQDYLGECLDSLRAQTLRSLQIILVDDGSTDGSAAVYERHAAEDPRIVVHRQPNAGLGAARNAGIRLATGRYITFLDSDDTLPEDAYEVMVRSLDPGRLNKRLVEAGIRVTELAVQRRSLEQVVLELTSAGSDRVERTEPE